MSKSDKEFKRLEGHPEPKGLPPYDGEESAAAPVAAATEASATADIDEVKGGGFGWAALGGLAAAVIVGAVAWMAGVWRTPANPQAPATEVIATYQFEGTSAGDTDEGSGASEVAVADDEPDAVYLFELNGSQIAENEALNEVAREARQTDADVTVNAYTDESGRTDYNIRLSEMRAKAVGDYLIAHGVSPSHVKTKGYGPTHAYATPELDRRAEVHIN